MLILATLFPVNASEENTNPILSVHGLIGYFAITIVMIIITCACHYDTSLSAKVHVDTCI